MALDAKSGSPKLLKLICGTLKYGHQISWQSIQDGVTLQEKSGDQEGH